MFLCTQANLGLFVLCEHAVHFIGHFSIDVNNNDSISEIDRTTSKWKYRIALKDSSTGPVRSLLHMQHPEHTKHTQSSASSSLGRSRLEEQREAEKRTPNQYRGTTKNRYISDYGLTEVSLSRHRQHGNRRP